MSSERLENSDRPPRPAPDRFLILLKTQGPRTAADLGTRLGITGEAARQQLVKLAADGLVAATTGSRGVGRPTQVWGLTGAGHARFPDAHADLATQLIRMIRTKLGEPALDLLISARESEARDRYMAEMEGVDALEERVGRLARMRTDEGYMAEWRRDGDDFLLIENHCPICAAATACQGFCRSELDVFRATLGAAATIDREDHIVAGDRRCVYRIRPASREETDAPPAG